MARLEEELDWELLGRCHCSEGGDAFFPPAQREAVRDASLQLASDLAVALAPAGAPPGDGCGRSVYVGAALAELAPLLTERIVLGREVRALNLANDETRELNRALGAVSRSLGLDLGAIETCGLPSLPSEDFDHAWLVSVLTDPESFPALHDELYGREGTDLATGRGDLGQDRRRVESLLDALLDTLAPSFVLTTTDEELALVLPACQRRGLRLSVPDRARLSAVVGDPVRICRGERA